VTEPAEAPCLRSKDDADVGLVLQGSVKSGTISVAQVHVNSAAAASCAVFPGILLCVSVRVSFRSLRPAALSANAFVPRQQ
jgi:hypothetical protein